MDQFFHIRMLLAIIFGLGLTHLLKGVAKLIERRGEKAYPLHLLWALFFFLLSIHFWWWEFKLSSVHNWDFFDYSIIVLYTTLFYINASLLFPDSLEGYEGFQEYYFSRAKWFFSILAAMFALDVFDTRLKTSGYISGHETEYGIAIALQITGCLLASRIRNEKFHMALVVLFILYRITWIYRTYYWLSPS